MSNILAFIPTLLSILGDLPKVLNAMLSLRQLIVDAEATGMDGPTKLAKVLNDFENTLNTINPTWGGDFAPIAKIVEDVVGEVVAFENQFANAKPKA